MVKLGVGGGAVMKERVCKMESCEGKEKKKKGEGGATEKMYKVQKKKKVHLQRLSRKLCVLR